MKILLKQMTLMIIFKKYNSSDVFQGKKIKVGAHKHNFFPAMHCWGVFPNSKRYSMQKKEIFVKLIYSIKTNLISSFFSIFLVKFWRNSAKYIVSRVASAALLGALKVAHLTAMTIQSAF